MPAGGIDVKRCGCGEEFDTMDDLFDHAREAHGAKLD